MLRTRLFSICLPVVLLLLAATAAQATYMGTVLGDSPVAYYRLGETGGTTAFDSASSPHDGTADTGVALGGATGTLAGDANKAATFNGTDYHSNISVAHNSAIDFGNSSSFSIEAWIKTSTDWGTIAAKEVSWPRQGYTLMMQAYGTTPGIYFEVDGGGGMSDYAYQYASGATSVSDGNWHQVVATYGGAGASSINLYVDGALCTSDVHSAGTLSGDIHNTVPLQIGDRFAGSGGDAFFVGTMDEVAIYGTALSANQVQAHYLAGTTPEPSVLVLMMTGLIGLLAYAWRKQK
jgi:hypothetical protein